MKKRLCFGLAALILVLCATLLLGGCGDKEAPTEDTNKTTATTEPGFFDEQEALAIAAEYFGIEEGSRDPDTGYVMSYAIVRTPTKENPTYEVALQWLVEVDGTPSHQSRLDTVIIDAVYGGIQLTLG